MSSCHIDNEVLCSFRHSLSFLSGLNQIYWHTFSFHSRIFTYFLLRTLDHTYSQCKDEDVCKQNGGKISLACLQF